MSACKLEKVTTLYSKLAVGPLKGLYKYLTPTAISLSGGIPLDSCFPFHNVVVNLYDKSVHSNGANSTYSLTNGKDLLLNYHRGDGIPTMKKWIDEHVHEIHRPIYSPVDSCVTIGSSDSYSKVLQLIKSDVIIYDQFAYGSAVNLSEAMGKLSVGVPTDDQGMIPSALRKEVLDARQKGLVVNLVYLVPVGHNPSGVTMPLSRKEELYRVCQELDLIIVEDGKISICFYNLNIFNINLLLLFLLFLQMHTFICISNFLIP